MHMAMHELLTLCELIAIIMTLLESSGALPTQTLKHHLVCLVLVLCSLSQVYNIMVYSVACVDSLICLLISLLNYHALQAI